MTEPFMGQICITSFNFPPKGWAACNGQLLPINSNQALFALLGTTYGGDGRVNFALPDLQGRVPLHMGGDFTLGQRGGEQAHTLSIAELPAHSHTVTATQADGTAANPNGLAPARSLGNLYGPPANLVSLAPASVTSLGGSQAHLNMQPFLVLNFIIALQGIFPSRD